METAGCHIPEDHNMNPIIVVQQFEAVTC